MSGTNVRLDGLGKETLLASLAYVLAFFLTFKVFVPVQGFFFPDYLSHASLLFLPHGVRVLAAWLLGWRSVIALMPGVFLAYFYFAGMDVFEISRLVGMTVAVLVPPATFFFLTRAGLDISPRPDRAPCWVCVMAAGIAISVLISTLTNLAFGSGPVDYFAYLIGDIFGLFFVMLMLMYAFRAMRVRGM